MPATTRHRIDWMPGEAARQAMREAGERFFPNLGQQELIDRLIICAHSALMHQRWVPPVLHGNDRDRWRLQNGRK